MTSDTGNRPKNETEAFEATQSAAAEESLEPANANAEPSGFAGGAGAPSEEELQAATIAALEAENADVKDRLLRLAADMENLRRRTEREIKDARQYAVTGFAREILSVADNLRRAIDAVPAEARTGEDASLVSLLDGVEMTERGLLASLEKHGVRRLEPEGQRFDPNFHQAMFEIPNAEIPNNTVVQVVQAGFAIGDRVLRPAMVGVSKGGPKQAAEKPATEAAADAGTADGAA